MHDQRPPSIGLLLLILCLRIHKDPRTPVIGPPSCDTSYRHRLRSPPSFSANNTSPYQIQKKPRKNVDPVYRWNQLACAWNDVFKKSDPYPPVSPVVSCFLVAHLIKHYNLLTIAAQPSTAHQSKYPITHLPIYPPTNPTTRPLNIPTKPIKSNQAIGAINQVK